MQRYYLRTIRTKASNSNVLGKYSLALEDASDVDYDIGFTKHEEDYNSLLNNPDFEDHMEKAPGINRFAHAQSLSLRKRIIEILDLLEKEISG